MIFNRRVRCNFHRELRENHESLYGLFLRVFAVRVVRGSRNSKGVFAIDSNRERRENREQKREGPRRAFTIPQEREREP